MFICHSFLQIQKFGSSNPLTALVPDLKGIDPDDAFSSVPYEKGFALLYYLQHLAGGPGVYSWAFFCVVCLRLFFLFSEGVNIYVIYALSI